MIVTVLVNDAPVALDDVFAELTIRHGRGSLEDGPLASSATLTLVDVTRELVQGFSAGDTLQLDTADGPRFVGRKSKGRGPTVAGHGLTPGSRAAWFWN